MCICILSRAAAAAAAGITRCEFFYDDPLLRIDLAGTHCVWGCILVGVRLFVLFL